MYFNKGNRKIPIYNVDTSEKKVAISFDAAWGADKTIAIMDILEEYDCKATFFLVGFWVDKYEGETRAIAERGFEIGTHSDSHPDLSKLSADEITNELKSSMDKIEHTCGVRPTLFRAPFGSYNNTVISCAEGLGLTTIQWNVDSLDWKGISASQITSNIVSKVVPGSIILCHNNSDYILEALPSVLKCLRDRGYTVTCVGDIILRDNYTIDHTGKQIANK